MLVFHAYEQFSISIRLSVYYKVAQWARKKFYAGFGWIPKLNIVMDTTMKAEYIAALVAAKEGVWVEKFVIELGVVPSEFTMKLYYLIIGAS